MKAPTLNRGWVLASALAVAMTVTAGVGSALADSITYILGDPNSAISSYTGPYVQLVVDLTTISGVDQIATFTFTSLSNGGNTYLMVDGGAADVNVNGAFTYNQFSEVLVGPGTTGFVTPTCAGSVMGCFSGPAFVDGFGTFNLTTTLADSFQSAASSISYSITGTLGEWSSAANVLTNNASGFLAAAHVAVCANPCTESNGAVAVGFAANGTASVPEPATLLLVGSSIGVLIGWRRWRNS
jgi:hypothetical protein